MSRKGRSRRSQQPKMVHSGADEIDKGSYTPLSFYMDSAANHPGPIRKGYRRVPEPRLDTFVLCKSKDHLTRIQLEDGPVDD
ncbi:hypothetical protein RYX36_021603, partial [Vicia faba]